MAHTSVTIFTIGHSTLPFEQFAGILKAFHIETLADVRTIPKSRHNPQFNQDDLKPALKTLGIEYVHLATLGGLRHSVKDSVNTAWRNMSFRGYADYMQTVGFAEGIEELITIARQKVTAIMCAEAVPWRCHRSLIGDALLVRGFDVEDIMSRTQAVPHKLTPWARVEGLVITYPGEPEV